MGMHIMSKVLAIAVIAAVATALPTASFAGGNHNNNYHHHDNGPKPQWATRTVQVPGTDCTDGALRGSGFLGLGTTSMVGFSKRTCEAVVNDVQEQYCTTYEQTGFEDKITYKKDYEWVRTGRHGGYWKEVLVKIVTKVPTFGWVEASNYKCEPKARNNHQINS